MCALAVLFLSLRSTAVAQYSFEADTLDVSKEILAGSTNNNTNDPSVSNLPFLVEKKDGQTSVHAGLLTLHPRAIPFVKDYLEIHEVRLTRMKSTALPYFTMIDRIMTKEKLPRELKYLAVIESDLKSSAVSWAGAVGPWQFMPETGRLMGLRVSRGVDERRDLYKSTRAAAKYLKDLYSQLNDWLLVIAAYNGGPARVEAAIRKAGSRNFWDLQYHLPAESRNHVKKFIATHYIMEGKGGVTTTGANDVARLSMLPPSKELVENTLMQTISGKYVGAIVASKIMLDPVVFRQLNPGFDAQVSADAYPMRLPADKMALFNEKKMEILEASIQHLLDSPVANEKFPAITERKSITRSK